MIHRIHLPAAPLDRFVEALVYFEGIDHSHQLDRFLPDGGTEILIDFHDAPQHVYDNRTLEKRQACRHFWASGIRTRPITIPSGNGSAMLVISFKSGAAAPFFPVPMNELADLIVDGDVIWGRRFCELRERLLAQQWVDRRFAIVEQFLIQRCRSVLEVNPCVAFAVKALAAQPDQTSIARLIAQIGYSQKHFIDMFRREVGVTPKTYLRIMRFQKALRTIDAAQSVDWAHTAHACGFYDQSHLIHDFKRFSGFTPAQYAGLRPSYPNYIPVG